VIWGDSRVKVKTEQLTYGSSDERYAVLGAGDQGMQWACAACKMCDEPRSTDYLQGTIVNVNTKTCLTVSLQGHTVMTACNRTVMMFAFVATH
jgi:hypothetical protein